MMRDSAVNGGLWFDDPGCAKQFGTPGEIEGARLSAFATCLEGLRLELSPRKSMLPDVVVLRYPPGFELEARVVREAGGLRMTWIGFSSRRAGDLDVPTITHDALETLRLAGQRDVPGVEAGAFTWLKLCIDAAGAVTKSVAFETTSPEAMKAVLAAVAGWKFRPFITRGQPLPACAMVRLAATDAPSSETLPLPPAPSRSGREPVVFPPGSKLLEGKRIAGTPNIVPDDITKVEISRSRTDRIIKVVGAFRVCVDEHGAVEQVLPLMSTGFPAYDRKLLAAMHDWRYSPFLVDDKPVPVCSYVRFTYQQR